MSGSSDSATAQREKRAAAASSVLAAIFLAGLKLVVGLATGSLGILAEAAHSALDLVAAAITFLAVRVSDRPPDEAFPYGRGKVENLSALVETLLLFVACAWIIYEALQRLLFHTVAIEATVWAFAVMGISVLVDVTRSRMLYAAAHKHESQALEADALHFSTDIWSSLVVILGLALVWTGEHLAPQLRTVLLKADALAALVVAGIVLTVSYELGKRTVDVLLDRAPADLRGRVARDAGRVEGVLGVGRVRLRRSGPRLFVDMNVEVDRNLAFEQTHAIATAVEERVQSLAPGADVVVHTDPFERASEDLAERIRSVAARSGASVHDIRVHADKGRLYIDLHVEVDAGLSLREAHDAVTRLENDVRSELASAEAITTHIEPRHATEAEAVDVTKLQAELVGRIADITNGIAGPASCHGVALRSVPGGFALSMHCEFDDKMPITQVHDESSRIEAALRKAEPALQSVNIHAEPRGR